MLIGNSFVGKTSTWKVLAQALTNMWYDSLYNNEGNSESSLLQEKPVHIEALNPKAISISELYGAFNPVTSEWSDGVLYRRHPLRYS